MAHPPGRLPLKPEELAALFGADDETALGLAEPVVPRLSRQARRPVSLTERIRRLPNWTLFLAGLLIGWLVIGWWVWPVRWTNSDLWDLSTRNQKAFVQLVADRYWTDRDLALAEATLGGWDRDAVNSLLVVMQAETISTDTRQRLDALLQALQLPGGEQSLLASIFNQDGILIALAIAVLPMFIAIGLAVSSQLRAKSVAASGDELAADDQEAELEELLADVQLEVGQMGSPGPDGATEQQATNPDEQQPGQADTASDEEEYEQIPDQDNPLGDLASLFAEEDTSVALLEAMCKGMPEVDMAELLTKSRDMLRRFREERPKR
ncbi:MAG: hypothetical protein HY870_21010 [Chloroflexi bacterium]|nr:hypothetical protein [Chloroflexota bacterium]